MRFLVKLELVDQEAGSAAERYETRIVPMVNACARLERQGRIVAGGFCAGGRSVAFIADAQTSEELDALLDDVPESARMRIGVTVLDPFRAGTQDEPAAAEHQGTRRGARPAPHRASPRSPEASHPPRSPAGPSGRTKG
jgi:hypothetical protein